jgi:hypothetical protein
MGRGRYHSGMRATLLGPLLLLPLLLACRGGGGAPAPTAYDAEEVKVSAPIVAELVRAATVCGVPVSLTAQDRAARLEAVAIELHQREGGLAARDNYLRSVQPPSFDPRQRGRDRSAYCGSKRIEIERMDGFLNNADGAALTQRAEAVRANLR